MLKSWSIAFTFSSDVKRILGAWAMVAFAYFGIMGVVLNLFLLRLGFDVKFIGLLIASGQLVWALTSLPAGAIGRRIGLRNAIIWGHAAVGLGMGMLILVELLPRPLWAPWIFLWWLVCWGGGGLNTVNSTPYIMSAATVHERKHAFSSQSAIIALFGLVGGITAGFLPEMYISIFGGTLDSPIPFRVTLWLVPLAYLLAVLIMTGARPIKLAQETSHQDRTGAPVNLFMLLGLIILLRATGEGAARAFFNIFLDVDLHVSATQIGAIMGVAQFLPILVALTTPLILERWGTEKTLAAVGVASAAALVLLGISQNWLLAAIGFSAAVSFVAIAGTAQNLFSQELVAERWRSISAGVINIGIAIGWATSAALGSFLVDAIGFRGYFFSCAALALLSSIVLVGYMLTKRSRVQASASSGSP